MSDEDDLDDIEPDQDDLEKEEEDKEMEEWEDYKKDGEEVSEEVRAREEGSRSWGRGGAREELQRDVFTAALLLQWMPTPLTEAMMKEGLSLLCKTGSGLAHAYIKLEAKDR